MCKVCVKWHVGSTFTSFRARFNSYKSSSRKLSSRVPVTQAERFTEANHHGFLEDVSFHIIGCLEFLDTGRDSRLQSFMPEGLSVRFMDH